MNPMTEWFAAASWLQLGLVWLVVSLVVGVIAGRFIHRGTLVDESERRRG